MSIKRVIVVQYDEAPMEVENVRSIYTEDDGDTLVVEGDEHEEFVAADVADIRFED